MSVKDYFRNGGDIKYRFTHKLDENSLVFDIGGYKGDWTYKMSSIYNCNFIIFEPVETYFNIIKKRFKDNPKVEACNIGLSNITTELDIYLSEDGTSIYSNSSKSEKIKIKNISDFIIERNIKTIDLIKINAEGVEYDIMDELIKSNFLTIIKKFQIQYHKLVPNFDERRISINDYLAKNNYKQLYCFDYVWEEWEKE